MSDTRKIRVLHAPTVTGGNPHGLSSALNRVGVDSTCMAVRDNYLQYPSDVVLCGRACPLLLREMKKILFILGIPFKYDIVHYNFGTTIAEPVPPVAAGESRSKRLVRKIYSAYGVFLQKLELAYLRLFSIPVFVHYQGDDARQGEYCRSHYQYCIANEAEVDYYTEESDRFKRQSIERICRQAAAVYAVNPDLLHVLPEKARFLPYSHIDIAQWASPESAAISDNPLRIGHAPTSRVAKGTRYIESALADLAAEGYQFELVLVEGMSNREAREIYQTVDVMIDQVLCGWYGGLAVEIMALGKPVVVYIREQDLKFVDPAMVEDFPFIQANPDTLEQTLRELLESPRESLLELGRRSRSYVEKWHDSLRIAEEIKKDYEAVIEQQGKLRGKNRCAG